MLEGYISNIGRELDRRLDGQICVWNRCTWIWSENLIV